MKLKFLKPKFIAKTLLVGIVALNGIGYVAAYMLTHYKGDRGFSLGVPRSQNYNSPQDFNLKYTTHRIPVADARLLDSWFIKSKAKSQGVVILFHGKDNNKSSLLAAAGIFHQLNYDTLLVDFRGSGKSSGNTTTIGIEEARDVVAAIDYLPQLNLQQPPILYGISLGSAAILRAIAIHSIQPRAIILELPFTSLLSAVKIRLANASLPPSPMAELIVFWGGVQHGFNGFAHKPLEYAREVRCPTLIMVGKRDRTVNLEAVEELYQNLNASKEMVIFPEAGHQILASLDTKLWTQAIADFLRQ